MLTGERSAEQAVIKHALLRGYLTGEQLREALVLREELRRLKRASSLLGLLRRYVAATHLPELAQVHAVALDPDLARRSKLPPPEEVPEDLLRKSTELLRRPPEDDPDPVREFLSESGVKPPSPEPSRPKRTRSPVSLRPPPPGPQASGFGQHPAAHSSGQHPAAQSSGQHPAAHSGQHPAAHSGQHPAAHSGQHPAAHSGQHPAHSGQHPAAHSGQHPAAHSGQHPAAIRRTQQSGGILAPPRRPRSGGTRFEPKGSLREQAVAAYRRVREEEDPNFSPHASVVFERLEQLGRGGMATVHRIRDHRLGREVALKILNPVQSNPDVEQRFRREAQVMARLDHPGIPPIYEAGSDEDGRPYLLMKVIEGEELTERISAHNYDRKVTADELTRLNELVRILLEVADAVAYAHAQDVVHRDLKPQNVMLGKFGEVLLLDWGLARDLRGDTSDDGILAGSSGTIRISNEEAKSLGLTKVGMLLGTPAYMSPEQAEGLPVDERADVFALGSMLVEVLTGRPPITGTSVFNKLNATLRGDFEMPRSRRPDLPAELDEIAACALVSEAADRTQSAQAFAAELRRYLAGQPLTAAAPRVSQPPPRGFLTLVIGAVFGGTLTAGIPLLLDTRRLPSPPIEPGTAIVSSGTANVGSE